MDGLINLLHLEDDPVDAELVQATLEDAGVCYRIRCVQTREAFETALVQGGIDLILADYRLPMFDGISALWLSQELGPDIPFIFVSGTMGEEAAISALTQGATDYVLKHNLARLPSAVERALQEARNQRERRQAQADIRKLSQVVEQSPVSIVITDIEGRIEFVNAKFTQVTGYTVEDVLGQNPSILKSGETPADEYRRLWETITKGGVWQGEFKNRKKSGEIFWEQATIAPVRDAENLISHYVAVKEDVTERKELEAQFRQVQKMEAIGQLAGGIAHDFNNILSAITGYTEISAATVDPESPVSEYLTQVLEASQRAKELINQILMFSREAEQELKPIRVTLPVKEALKLIRASLPASIEIQSKILSRTSALADPTQIHQIVMNLCTNAAHAMRENGGRLEVLLTDIRIDHEADRKRYPDAKPGDYIRLRVADQGHGIDPHHLHRIFDPFFTTKEMGEGTGMGLSVVHGIVKSYGGSIYVHSRLGEGCTFEILIPALEPTAPGVPISDTPIPTGDESILFVDDETMIVEIVKKMLETLGYRVSVRTSAIEAFEAFCNHPERYDLLVTDMIMPKMSGLDLADKILEIRPGFPIVLCTGFSIKMQEDAVARRNIRDIIYKPILRREIATVVRKVLDQR
jgi:PAS domain S-box-containing protein